MRSEAQRNRLPQSCAQRFVSLSQVCCALCRMSTPDPWPTRKGDFSFPCSVVLPRSGSGGKVRFSSTHGATVAEVLGLVFLQPHVSGSILLGSSMFRSKAIAQQPGMSNISSAIRDYHLGLLVHLSQPGTSWNRVQCSRAGVCLMPVIPSASFAASCCYWRFPCFLSSDRYLRLLTQLAYISLRFKFLAARVRKPYHRSHWPSSPPAVAL